MNAFQCGGYEYSMVPDNKLICAQQQISAILSLASGHLASLPVCFI